MAYFDPVPEIEPAPAGRSDARWGWVPVVLVTLLLASGGWIWHLSAQATGLHDVTQRVAALEQNDKAREPWHEDISSRLARIETKLEIVLRDMHVSR